VAKRVFASPFSSRKMFITVTVARSIRRAMSLVGMVAKMGA
jgi:hypothetical protein